MFPSLLGRIYESKLENWMATERCVRQETHRMDIPMSDNMIVLKMQLVGILR